MLHVSNISQYFENGMKIRYIKITKLRSKLRSCLTKPLRFATMKVRALSKSRVSQNQCMYEYVNVEQLLTRYLTAYRMYIQSVRIMCYLYYYIT
jgi:hypothetical protein